MSDRLWLKAVAVLLVLSVVAGCSTVGYYSQIVSGHMKIVMGKKPLATVVQDDKTDSKTRHRLQVAAGAREFAIQKLQLPDNDSYTSFYDTKRNYVTWNVVAADEFSFNPRIWCFPVAGCVSYRGYYTKEKAQAYADRLAKEGYDVAVNGATAYSTLGWFADPLLNTMLNRSDASIAALIFHEMAHQKLYVGNDSKFNESFAGFVEQQGLALWQQQQGTSDQLTELEIRRKRHADFIQLLRDTRSDLQALYESGIDEPMMRDKKAARYQQLLLDYQSLKLSWNGYRGYDGWFQRELNNARLVSVATYTDYIPAFEVLFDESNRDFETFYLAAQKLSELAPDKRREKMQLLLDRATAHASADSR